MSSVTKSGESLATIYDGSLLKTVTSTGTLSQALSLTYNNDLRITNFTYAGSANNFGYDNDGLLTSSGRFTITRNAQNGLPTAVSGGALNLSRTINSYGELSSQTQTVNSTPAGTWALTYNNNGQIITKNETVAGITTQYVYTYDTNGRLTKVEKDGTLVEEYRYTGANPLGTRTYEMNSLRGITGRSLTYNAEDQLLNVGTAAYQYNADGFLSKKTDSANVTTYDYSSRGELLNVALPNAQNIAYVYDPLGRRIAKKINGTIVEKYLWSGLTRLLAVCDGSNTLVMRFEYSDDRVPNVMTKGSATYYLTYDQVGSLRAVYDATGTIVKRIDYDSFGNIIADTNSAFTVPFGFAGGLDDRDIGLVHFGFRDYDPATGRWTAKDPIGFAGGDVDVYGYVEGDPINFVDPDGLQAIACPPIMVVGPPLPIWDPFVPINPEDYITIPIDPTVTINYSKGNNDNDSKSKNGGGGDDDGKKGKEPLGKPESKDGYKPPKNWNGKKVKNPNGKGSGYPDKNGNVWVPTNHKGSHSFHWDVQHKGGSYITIYPR